MTIQSPTARVSFACNGSSTVFPVNIQAYLATDFLVLATNTAGSIVLVLYSDYTMSSSGTLAPPFWSLTTTAIYPTGTTLQVILNPSETQLTQYVQGQAFPSLAVQTNIDRLTQMVIRQTDLQSRSLDVPDGDINPQMTLPSAAQRANKNLGFDVNGNPSLSLALASGTISTATLAPFLNLQQSSAEGAAGVTPVGFQYWAQPWLWVRREGCVLDGSTDDTIAFNKCLAVAAALSAPNFALLIDGPMFLNTSNITIPQNVQLSFVGGGKLKPGSGKTITLGMTPEAGLWQIFDVSAGGVILMPNNWRTKEVWAEWWGALGDGVFTTNDVPINAAINSISNSLSGSGGTVRLGSGRFFISGPINLLDYCSIRGLNDFTKIIAQPSWSGGAIMIIANNSVGNFSMFDSRLEYLTIDANNIAGIQIVVQSQGWQDRCGIFNCELLHFTQFGFFYNHGFGGAAVLTLENTDFTTNDTNTGVCVFATNDGTTGWLKLNVNNCAFSSNGNPTNVNGCVGLQLGSGATGGRIICSIQGIDVEALQYGIIMDSSVVLCGAGLGGGGQTPGIAPNSIIRCLTTWQSGSGNPGSISVTGAKIGGWTNMIVDSNRSYLCAALEPYDGNLVWPPTMQKPQGTCVITGGAAPALGNTTSFGVCSKLAGATIAHTAAGEQTLTLSTSMDAAADIICKATSNDPNAPQISTNASAANQIQIFTFNKLGAATDCALFVLDIFHTP